METDPVTSRGLDQLGQLAVELGGDGWHGVARNPDTWHTWHDFAPPNHFRLPARLVYSGRCNGAISMVREAGLEPARYFYPGILSPVADHLHSPVIPGFSRSGCPRWVARKFAVA